MVRARLQMSAAKESGMFGSKRDSGGRRLRGDEQVLPRRGADSGLYAPAKSLRRMWVSARVNSSALLPSARLSLATAALGMFGGRASPSQCVMGIVSGSPYSLYSSSTESSFS